MFLGFGLGLLGFRACVVFLGLGVVVFWAFRAFQGGEMLGGMVCGGGGSARGGDSRSTL